MSIICPKCGEEFTKQPKFCPECGYRFPQTIRCPQCGMEYEKKPHFCLECGYHFSDEEPVKTEEPISNQMLQVAATAVEPAQKKADGTKHEKLVDYLKAVLYAEESRYICEQWIRFYQRRDLSLCVLCNQESRTFRALHGGFYAMVGVIPLTDHPDITPVPDEYGLK